MNLNLYSCYDSKAKAWTLPFFMSVTDSIHRAWTDVCNDPSSKFAQHPDDYSLFHIGEFNCLTGGTTIYESKQSIGLARHFVKSPTSSYQFDLNGDPVSDKHL